MSTAVNYLKEDLMEAVAANHRETVLYVLGKLQDKSIAFPPATEEQVLVTFLNYMGHNRHADKAHLMFLGVVLDSLLDLSERLTAKTHGLAIAAVSSVLVELTMEDSPLFLDRNQSEKVESSVLKQYRRLEQKIDKKEIRSADSSFLDVTYRAFEYCCSFFHADKEEEKPVTILTGPKLG